MAHPIPLRFAIAAKFIAILAVIFLFTAATNAQEKSLFNGVDLTGWLSVGDSWSVKDGAITCRPSDDTPFLVWQGGFVSDFEFTCKFKLNHNFDKKWWWSGIRFRNRVTNPERLDVTGDHADLNLNFGNTGGLLEAGPHGPMATHGERVFTVNSGDILHPTAFYVTNAIAEFEKAHASFKAEDWNEYKVVALGARIQIYLNGFQTVDAIDETSTFARSGVLALVKGPIQFKDITLKELSGVPPAPPASRLPVEPPARSKTVRAAYIRQGSASLKEKGFRNGRFPVMDTDDPNGVFDSKPVYFDIHSGTEIHYEVQSGAPLTELSYTGIASSHFRIEVRDSKNDLITSAGPYNGGFPLKSIRMPLPNLTNFQVVLKTDPVDWLLVEDIHFGSAALADSSTASSTPKERSLFNGADLAGWMTVGDFWKVKDGAIACEPSEGVTALVWRDGTPSDFEFNCKFRFSRDFDKRWSYSGVRFRSRITNPDRLYMTGPCAEVNLNFGPTGTFFEDAGRGGLGARGARTFVVNTEDLLRSSGVYVSNSIKDADKARASFKPDDWNDYKIIAARNRIAIFLNGFQTTDVIDETPYPSKSGCLALREGPIQFKDITLKEIKGIPPNPWPSRLPVKPPQRSGVNASFLKQGSASLKEKGFRDGRNPKMETDDPDAVFESKPVYFDMRFANEVHYDVESIAPLTELSYTGVRFANFRIEILDPKGALITSSGPYSEGNPQKVIRMPLPNLTHFQVALKSDPIDWMLVEDLHFASAPPGSVPGLLNWNPATVVAANPTPFPRYVARAVPTPIARPVEIPVAQIPPPPRPAPPAPPAKDIDPFVGRWKMGNDIAVFSDDGKAHRSSPNFNEDGRWRKKDGDAYEIDWSGGRQVQEVHMHFEHQRLMGRDRRGRSVLIAYRVRESDQ
jgi:hypothetical protein